MVLPVARSAATTLNVRRKVPSVTIGELPSASARRSRCQPPSDPPSSFRPDRVTVSPASSASIARISSGPRGGGAPSSAKAASSSLRLSSRGRSNGSTISAAPSCLMREPINGASAQSSASSASRRAEALAASRAGSAQSDDSSHLRIRDGHAWDRGWWDRQRPRAPRPRPARQARPCASRAAAGSA